jgi:hypothetical protein
MPAEMVAAKCPSPRYSRWEWAGWILLVVALVALFPVAMYRVVQGTGGTDFPRLHAAGRYVLEHRQIEPTAFWKYYWPSVDAAFAGLAWMPLPLAAAVWYAIVSLAWIGLLATTARYLLPDLPPPGPRQAALVASLLVLPLALDHLCLGAFHILMVWAMVAGLARASRGRDWSGGFLLGLAVWIKLLPAIGVGYLVLKRKWRAAAVAVGSAVLMDLALAVPVFGLQQTWQLHRKWWENEATGASHRLFDHAETIDEDRLTNQSPAILLRRLLTQQGIYPGCPWASVAFGDLSPTQLRIVYYAVLGGLGVVVLTVCRRPARTTSPSQWATEIALVTLATLWCSPVAWSYHFTAVMPALAVVLGRRYQPPWLVWTMVALWLVALALTGSDLARALGNLFWAGFLVGVFLMAMAPRRPQEGT